MPTNAQGGVVNTRKGKRRRRRFKRKMDKRMAAIARVEIDKHTLGQESKHFDVPNALVPFSISTVPAIQGLNAITTGTGANARVGDEVRPKGLQIRFRWDLGDATQLCRMLLVVFKDQTTTPPVLSDVLEAAGAIENLYSPYKINGSKKYRVLHDQLLSATAVTSENQYSLVTIGPKMLGKSAKWTDGTGTNHKSGGVYLMLMSDSSATPHPSFSFYSRYRYVDIA